MGCGSSAWALQQCETTLCDCVVSEEADASEGAYEACVADADATICASYVAAQCNPADGGFSACTEFVTLAATFCSAD